ncbi:XRE family transcriptional regulator [Streptomyces virginiae]|uniref:XRE family transcriptional regulator n=1 Tax=Streptomyces virginiae TaxID=1961 RepID=UPI003641DA69
MPQPDGTEYLSLGAADIQRRVSAGLVTVQQQLDNPRLWSVAASLMTLYAKTFPGSDGAKAVHWYRMAAKAADASDDLDTRVRVRGRAAIALSDKPSLGLLNALFGKAHTAALRGDHTTARRLFAEGRRVFDRAGSHEQTSDAVPHWRLNVFISLLAAASATRPPPYTAQDTATAELPETLPRFATHLETHRGLMLARSGDTAAGTAYPRAALDAPPPEKHSLTLRLLMAEVEQA